LLKSKSINKTNEKRARQPAPAVESLSDDEDGTNYEEGPIE
jgi:hypothetical protein